MNYQLSITNQKNPEKTLELRTNDFEFAKKVFFELSQNLIKSGFDIEFTYLKNGHMFISKSLEKSVITKLTIER